MDKDTAQLNKEIRNVRTFVHSDEYKTVRNIAEKIIERLSTVDDIDDAVIANPNQLAIELQARKMTIRALTEFLQLVEGTAQETPTDTGVSRESLIVRM